MPRYILLLHEEVSAGPPPEMSPEAIQAIIEKYTRWSEKMAKAGKLVAGEKLRDAEGRVMRGAGPKVAVKDGPYAETKEVIGGFYILEAASYDEVVQLSRDHPHLEFAGTIEVREIEPV